MLHFVSEATGIFTRGSPEVPEFCIGGRRPNEAAIIRLAGAILLEQNDEWAVCRRYMTLETLAKISNDGDEPTMIAAQ